MNKPVAEIIEGMGSDQSPLVKELLKEDSRPLSVALKAEGNYMPDVKKVPFSAYYDRDYAEKEMECVWKKSWQFACREEDIPNVGDRLPYTVGTLSFVIVRSARDQFRAFHNTCLHRGTRLCDHASGGDSIRCPFHGWQWNIDGTLKNIPGRWDFAEVDDASYALPEIKVGTWGGCVFVNPDPEAGPLEDALGVIPEHFAHFQMENRFTLVRTQKKVRANWKTVWAAFLEAYHVAETHYDAVDFNGDSNTKVDIFDNGTRRVGRLITPSAVPSPSLEGISRNEAAITAAQSFANALGPDAVKTLPDFDEVPDFGRKDLAQWRRETMKTMLGVDLDHLSDTEMVDSIQYDMFPNFGPWLGEGLPLMYQFLPYGDNPDESLFTVRLMAPCSPVARPPAAPLTHLDYDEMFESLPQWGRIAHVFDQDMSNLPLIQKGLRSAAASTPNITLGRYQEKRIALMHEFLDEMMAKHGE